MRTMQDRRPLKRQFYLTWDSRWQQWHLGDTLGWINWFRTIPEAMSWVNRKIGRF
jgi:hypothetical protein